MTGGSSNSGGGGSTIENVVTLPTQFRNDNNWIVYADKLSLFFIAYKITDDNQKRAILLTSLDEDVYDKLSDLCFPETPGSKAYKDVCEIMKANFTKQVCVFIERLKFYEAKQAAEESVNDFVARIKKLARHCGFGGYLKEVLRDKFVCGLARGPVFDKLCEQKGTESFEDLVKVALQKELAVKQRTATDSLDVCKVEHYKSNRSNYSKGSNTRSEKSSKFSKGNCYACGESSHLFRTCRYKEYRCKICKTTGHLAKVCKQKGSVKKPAAPSKQNNYIDLEDELDFERLTLKYVDLEVNNVSGTEEEDEKIFTQLSIRDRKYQFEVDTGSPISACSEKFYQQNFSDLPLQPFTGGLRSYNKTTIENRGYFEVEVMLKSNSR